MSGDVIGNVILTVYRKFPQLTQNKTFTQVFATVVSNPTVLNRVAEVTGLNSKAITESLQYLTTCTAAFSNKALSNKTSNKTYVYHPECNRGDLTTSAIFPVIFIILLFSFLAKRQHPKKLFGVVWTRPGLCIPLNLVDSYENRLGYACAFGATVTNCLGILFFSNYDTIFPYYLTKIQRDPSNPGWVGVFWKMLAMAIIGLAYYPMFACFSTEYKLLGGCIGLAYSCFWYTSLMPRTECYEITFLPKTPGQEDFAFSFPVALCLILLACMYLIIVVKCLVKLARRCLTTADVNDYEIESWKNSYKYKYVMRLLQATPKECREQKAIDKIKYKMYKCKPEFKYSTRVVCTYVVSMILIYEVGIVLLMGAGVVKSSVLELLLSYSKDLDFFGVDKKLLMQWMFIAYVAWFVALGISSSYSIVLLANMLSWYRGHITRLQRGDKSFLPVQALSEKTPSYITVAALKYSGYQVAYFAWSYLFLHILLFVIGTVLGIQVVLPVISKTFDSFLWTQIKSLWPAIVVSLTLYLCQYLMAKFVFLHSHGSTLALDNRRLFHICTYFLFFFNVFLGVISLLKRILIGIVLGGAFLGRLQKSILPRDFEVNDPGFDAYVGYLYLEHTHSNPVLVTFCRMLLNVVNDKEKDEREAQRNNPTAVLYQERKTKRIRNRWFLLLTLANNPDLSEFRRQDKFILKSPIQALGTLFKDYSLLSTHIVELNVSGNENELSQREEEGVLDDEVNQTTSL